MNSKIIHIKYNNTPFIYNGGRADNSKDYFLCSEEYKKVVLDTYAELWEVTKPLLVRDPKPLFVNQKFNNV